MKKLRNESNEKIVALKEASIARVLLDARTAAADGTLRQITDRQPPYQRELRVKSASSE